MVNLFELEYEMQSRHTGWKNRLAESRLAALPLIDVLLGTATAAAILC